MYQTEFSLVYLHNTYGHGAFVCRVLHANSSSWQHQSTVHLTFINSGLCQLAKNQVSLCVLLASCSTSNSLAHPAVNKVLSHLMSQSRLTDQCLQRLMLCLQGCCLLRSHEGCQHWHCQGPKLRYLDSCSVQMATRLGSIAQSFTLSCSQDALTILGTSQLFSKGQ